MHACSVGWYLVYLAIAIPMDNKRLLGVAEECLHTFRVAVQMRKRKSILEAGTCLSKVSYLVLLLLCVIVYRLYYNTRSDRSEDFVGGSH